LKKESLYLDTSVMSAYYDEREPLKLELTRNFWKRLSEYEPYISRIVQRELEAIENNELRVKVLDLIKDFIITEVTEEEELLSDEYIKAGVIPKKYENDALQIAIGSTNAIDYFVSWNFKHIVKVKTRRMVNLINLRYGYKPIEIITPSEL